MLLEWMLLRNWEKENGEPGTGLWERLYSESRLRIQNHGQSLIKEKKKGNNLGKCLQL